MATLDVHERMGMKVDREAVATLVLPQLWAMSVGPCEWDCRETILHETQFIPMRPVLNIAQFQRFMTYDALSHFLSDDTDYWAVLYDLYRNALKRNTLNIYEIPNE
jgi:hypothetical protein